MGYVALVNRFVRQYYRRKTFEDMMNKNYATLILWAIAIVCMFSCTVHATSGIPKPFTFVFKPIDHPVSAGPVLMEFSFTVKKSFCEQWKCCDDIQVELQTSEGVRINGNRQWSITLDKSLHYETIISAEIPPNDTSSIIVKLGLANGGQVKSYAYFVTTGDSVEFWKGYPMGPIYAQPDWKPDTTRYEVKIDLRSRRQREYIFSLENWIGSIEPTKDSGFYIIRCRRDQFNGLTGEGLKCEYLVEPPPYPTGPAGSKIKWKRDTTSHRKQFKRKRDPKDDSGRP